MFVFENRRFLFRCGDLDGENENNIAFLFWCLKSQKNKQLIEFCSNVWKEEQEASNWSERKALLFSFEKTTVKRKTTWDREQEGVKRDDFLPSN